jgi:hypothetical protein
VRFTSGSSSGSDATAPLAATAWVRSLGNRATLRPDPPSEQSRCW